MTTGPARDEGFTLIELLVALAIFALIAAAGVFLIGTSVRAQESSRRHLARIEQSGRLTALLAADCAQAVDRRTGSEPAFMLAAPGAAGPVLAFTRAGPPMGVERISLEVKDGALIRHATRPDGETRDDVLLEQVRALSVRAKRKGEWSADTLSIAGQGLPDAIELTVDQARAPPLRLVLVLGVWQR